ncbi:MAG: hypothetical protein FWG61_00310, partial [Firmicutes bacterium]|nr:hypothetical protein [Bacillota bacterium]
YTPNYFFQTTLIEPGKYYNYVVGLTPSNYTFEVGTIIGVMIYGTDPLYTPLLTPECSAEFDVKLGADSYITIPFNKAPVLEATTVEEIVEIIETASEEIVEEVIE